MSAYVHGAAAISAFGFEWRGLGQAVLERASAVTPSRQLAPSHGTVPSCEVPAIPQAIDVDAKAAKLMSHPARLAAIAMRLAIGDAQWDAQVAAGMAMYLGVGPSGASMEQLRAMLDASICDHAFSLARFGTDGLNACNPLFAFQLMNNFTLCHGAILNGVRGPNSAFYSRGTGTVCALAEALWQIESGECEFALAGAADSALHPVTWDQVPQQLSDVPGEGAGLLALGSAPDGALARVARTSFHSEAACQRNPALPDQLLATANADDVVLLAGLPMSEYGGANVLDAGAVLGNALAATPALAWCAALDLLQQPRFRRAHVLTRGADGGMGLAVLESCT